jgi:hypothetical protein
MTLPRLLFAGTLLLVTPFAAAAPGDPRLITGALEWPQVLGTEAFVIVRGDDGVLYYVGVGAARREGAIAAGTRVSVLGIEGRSAHEITAFALGSGPTADAALAQLQSPRPVVTAPAPPAPVASPPPGAPGAPPASVQPAPASAAPPLTPAPGPSAGAAAAGPPAAAGPSSPAPAAPAPAAWSGAAAVAPPPMIAPTAVVTPPPAVPVGERRWTELTGQVETFVGRTLVLRVDGGRVSVDTSSLSGNLERMVAPGSTVKVYGVPVEMRFKALGFIDADARGRGGR